MPDLPRVRMQCSLTTGAMEIGRVDTVRPVAAALLATACAGGTGAAAPAGGTVEEGALLVAARLDVPVEVRLGALFPACGWGGCVAVASCGERGPALGSGDRSPALSGERGERGGGGAAVAPSAVGV
jgi:hypothetical protein